MENIYSLHSKTALITGGGSGIGLGIARQFSLLGARVVITGRNLENLMAAQKELGDNCLIIQNDIKDKSSHQSLIRQVENEAGPLDILVNNAGIHHKIPTLDVSDEAFQSIMDVNLNSVFSLSREVLKIMVPRGSGSVINISSMAGIYGVPLVAAYSSSKTALLGLTRSMAAEFSWSGVRINAIAPGFIDSDMVRNALKTDPERKQKILSRTPMKRLGTPDEIGYAAAFLASDAARFITGVCLPVDGGNSIGF